MSNRGKSLLLAVVASLVALLLGEAIVRVVILVFDRPQIVVSDAATGWSGEPNLRNVDVGAGGGHFHASTDRDGRRVTSAAPDRTPHDSGALVLVGDSFAYGQNVEDHETAGWRLGKRFTDRAVIDLGVPGWGPDQELVSLERFFSTPDHPAVRDVVVLVYENDFRDVQRQLEPYLGYSKPVFRVVGDSLVQAPFERSWLERLMDYSRLAWVVRIKYTSRPSQLLRERRVNVESGTDLVVACLDRMRRVAAANGARIHIFAHRRLRRATGMNPEAWAGFLLRAGATDITDQLRLPATPDPVGFDGGHWSAEGHRRAALIIGGAL